MASGLREAGWLVRTGKFEMSDLKAARPCIVIVSLRRLPSHGREVADAIRSTKWGREVPIIFVDGLPEKAETMRLRFPDNEFISREHPTETF